MKSAIFLMFVFSISIHASAQLNKDITLPKAWTTDFTISLSHSGSMDGSNTKLTFTYDSIKYIRNSGMNAPKETYYLMSEADRTEIFRKMNEFKVDKIHSEATYVPVNDGWSTLLSFGKNCVQGGTSATMSDKDKAVFSTVYSFLEEFAASKARKKLKR